MIKGGNNNYNNPATQGDSKPKPVLQLVKLIKQVDTSSSQAKSNKTSMSDGKGGRITFNDQLSTSKTRN